MAMTGIGIGQTTTAHKQRYGSQLAGAKGEQLSRSITKKKPTTSIDRGTAGLAKDLSNLIGLGAGIYEEHVKMNEEATSRVATDMLVQYRLEENEILSSNLTLGEKKNKILALSNEMQVQASKSLDMEDEDTKRVFDEKYTQKHKLYASDSMATIDAGILDQNVKATIVDSRNKMKVIPDKYSADEAVKDQADAIRLGYTTKNQVILDVVNAKDKFLENLVLSNSPKFRNMAISPEVFHSQYPEYTEIVDGKIMFKEDADKGIVAAISAGIRDRQSKFNTIAEQNQQAYNTNAINTYKDRIINSLGNSAELLKIYSDIKNDKQLSSEAGLSLLDQTDTRVKVAKANETNEYKVSLRKTRGEVVSQIGELQLKSSTAKTEDEKKAIQKEVAVLVKKEEKNRAEILSVETPSERVERLAEEKRLKKAYKEHTEALTIAPAFSNDPKTMFTYQNIINGTYKNQMALKVSNLKTMIINTDPLYLSNDSKMLLINKLDKSFDTLQVNAVKNISENIKGYDTTTLISAFQKDPSLKSLVTKNKEALFARGNMNDGDKARVTTSLAFSTISEEKLSTVTPEQWQKVDVLLKGGISYTELQNMGIDLDLDVYKNIDNLEDAEAAMRIAQTLTYIGIDSSEGWFSESEVGNVISTTFQATELDMPGWDRFNTVSKVSVKSDSFGDIFNQKKLHSFLEYKDQTGRTLFGGMLSNDIGDNIDDNGVIISKNKDGSHNVNIKGSAGFQDTLVTFKEINGAYYPTYMNSKFYNPEDIKLFIREK